MCVWNGQLKRMLWGRALSCVSGVLAFLWLGVVWGQATISTSTWVGGGGDDQIRGVKIQQDGTIVIAGILTGGAWLGKENATLLNGATAASTGVVVRLSHDGKRVLSVTHVADKIYDMALDGCDNIYLAAETGGLLKLDVTASALLWKVTPGYVYRVDVASDGTSAVLLPSNQSEGDRDSKAGTGTIVTFDASGKQLGSFKGHRNTTDLCIDAASKTVVFLGWRQANSVGPGGTGKKLPVQIAYMRGADYTGNTKWTHYDWPVDPKAPDFLNKPENNMADTRGYRCAIGGDGKLYATFEAAGGNHIFRYSPEDVTKKVKIVGGDKYHEFYNSKSEHKTFFARYDAATGAYLLGQQLCARLSSGKCNSVRARRGEIQADATGRVFIVGTSAAHLPLSFNPPGTGDYGGGGYVLVMSADLTKRLYLTRMAPQGEAMSVGVRLFGGKYNLAYGGTKDPAKMEMYLKDPAQRKAGGGKTEGFFAAFNAHPPNGAGRPANCGKRPENPMPEPSGTEPIAEPPVASDASIPDAGGADVAGQDTSSSGSDNTSPEPIPKESGQRADVGQPHDGSCGCDQASVSSVPVWLLLLLCFFVVTRSSTALRG